jgi:hypothetical protein
MGGVNAYAKDAAPPAAALPKALTPQAVAGVYTRNITQQPGTLTVKAASAGKIDVTFDCALESVRKGKGTAHGVVKLNQGFAVLDGKGKGGTYSISLRFQPGSVIVLYNGDGFGDVGVEPSGVYRKK